MIENRPEIQPNPQKYELIDSPNGLLERWSSALNQAQVGDPVIFRTMHLRDGETIDVLKPLLEKAVQRGLKPKIIFDPISYYLSDVDNLSYLRFVPSGIGEETAEDYEKNRALIVRLREAGITVENSRPESLKRQIFPYVGADHIKGVRIGNKFWMVDKNLEDTSFMKMHGFAVEMINPEIVDKLTGIIESTTSPDKDQEIPIDSKRDIFILQDAGKRGKSKIYDKAVEMAKNENDFIGISFQYMPEAHTPFSDMPFFKKLPFFSEGRLVGELESAIKKGVNVQSLTSSQSWFTDSPLHYVMERINAKSNLSHKNGLRFIFTPNGVHAKYVVTPDAVLFGTNNFAEAGIKAGTAEIAIYSTDPELVSLIRDFHERLVAVSMAFMTERRKVREKSRL